MRTFQIAVAILAFLIQSSASAQDQCAHCNAPLDKAAYDYHHVDTTSITDEQFKQDFCSIKESIDSNKQDTNASILAKAFYAEFSQNKDEYRRLYTQYCQSTSYRFTSYNRGVVLSRLVHDESLRVWESCTRQCMETQGGGFQHRVANDAGRGFTYEIRWRPALGIDRVRISQFAVDGGSCQGTMRGKRVGSEWIPLQCTRNADDHGVSVVYVTSFVNDRVGGHTAMVVPPPAPQPVVVTDTVEKSITCVGDRVNQDCVRDGGGGCQLTDPDRKIFIRFPCTAPAPVTRIGTSECIAGVCGWMWRVPGFDQIEGNVGRAGWKTNSSDSSSVRTTVYYNESSQRCTANCAPPPPIRLISNPKASRSQRPR